jgi:hypothetical protein
MHGFWTMVGLMVATGLGLIFFFWRNRLLSTK